MGVKIQTVTTVKAEITDDMTGKAEVREFDSEKAANDSVTEFVITINKKVHKFNVTTETAEVLANSFAALATDSKATDSDRNDARRNLGSLFPRNITGAKGSVKSGKESDKAGMTRSDWLKANAGYAGVGALSNEHKAAWLAHLATETESPATATENGNAAK
jgi:hypothetical protein